VTATTWSDEDREVVRKGNNFYHLMFMITVPAVVAAIEGGACRCTEPDPGSPSSLVHAPSPIHTKSLVHTQSLIHTPCECSCLHLALPDLPSPMLRSQLELLPFIQRVDKERLSPAEYNSSFKLKRCDVVMGGRAKHSRERGADTYMAACGLEQKWSYVRSVYSVLTGINMATPHLRLRGPRRAEVRFGVGAGDDPFSFSMGAMAMGHAAAVAARPGAAGRSGEKGSEEALIVLFQPREACAADPWRVGSTVSGFGG
jgi:hypothetical protein